ncbi:MAG TPA: GNAT family N-acetyltransferase [Tenuifilaceae bacterium]|nr:GNAT family N-acetyltransferase [Tenuifilaceae bacterium]
MEQIVEPIDKALIEKELTPDKFVRETNHGKNQLYIVNAHNSPYIMQEIGRLRELTFRSAGGGTGNPVDIDKYDVSEKPYQQLIVWDPQDREILGGYRFHNIDPSKGDEMHLSTIKLFNFSDDFKRNYMPYMIELGRSFVQPKYQSTGRTGKGLYALDNLWDGLGALVVRYPGIKYFFGKVTMYRSYNTEARNLLLYFFQKHFADTEGLVTPIDPMEVEIDRDRLAKIFTGSDYKEDYKILSKEVRALGENIPPLINSYMNLSPSMKVFGTILNPDFGNVEETGIMITIDDIYESKVERHILSFFRRRFKYLKSNG